MKITWKECPALRNDLCFYSDEGEEVLTIREDGGFMVRGKTMFGKDLITATGIRSALMMPTAAQIAGACELVTKFPNPWDSPESHAAWNIKPLIPFHIRCTHCEGKGVVPNPARAKLDTDVL